jgi:ketosteroid isomerase-like protein
VSEQDNVQVLKDIYAAFGRGDIPTILDAVSNDAQIHHAGLADTVPWGSRTYTGPAEWEQFFRDLGATLDPEAFDAQTYVAEGERVVGLGQYRFRAKATGKRFESPWLPIGALWVASPPRPARQTSFVAHSNASTEGS